MDNLFASIFKTNSNNILESIVVIFIALFLGVGFSLMCNVKTKSSKSFLITTSLLPVTVALVIMLVNGNIGAGIAVAGAFSLVRFRSAQGTAKEICIIFIAMASGLALGMGYIAYAVIFILIAGSALIIFSSTKIWERKPNLKEKRLQITIPEGLDYTTIFDDLLIKYTEKAELIKVKSVNMGSMFRITYLITLKDVLKEKHFIDELRCRNGNLEISLERVELDNPDL